MLVPEMLFWSTWLPSSVIFCPTSYGFPLGLGSLVVLVDIFFFVFYSWLSSYSESSSEEKEGAMWSDEVSGLTTAAAASAAVFSSIMMLLWLKVIEWKKMDMMKQKAFNCTRGKDCEDESE